MPLKVDQQNEKVDNQRSSASMDLVRPAGWLIVQPTYMSAMTNA